MHKRTEIRTALQTLLKNDSRISIEHIYNVRILEIPKNKVPLINIQTPDETAEISEDLGNYTRSQRVILTIGAKGKAFPEELATGEKYIDEVLDDLCQEVEDVLLIPWQTLDKTIFNMSLTGTITGFNGETNDMLGVAEMEFGAVYRTAMGS